MKVTIQLTNSYPEKYVLDSRKYRGKGRPRKTDYTPMIEYMVYMQKISNTLLNNRLNEAMKEGVAPQKKEAPHWMDCNCECHGFNEDGEDENCPHCMPELYPDYVVAPQKGQDEISNR